MESLATTRRRFVQAIALLPTISSSGVKSASMPESAMLGRSELELPPGLAHLNTASAGPTTHRVLQRTIEAWHHLERDPVAQSYYDEPDTVFTAADRVRSKAAALIGASPDEILTTRGTTDGITTLSFSVRLKEGDHVLLSNLEHEGGETGWLHRQRIDRIVVDRVHLPLELHDPHQITNLYASAITPQTKAIIVSHVIATTGLRMPVAEIASLARRKGILCIVDGAQAVGHIAVDVRSIGCDAYATSGHKWLMGPKGTGFTYIAKGAQDMIQPPQWQLSKQVGADSAGLVPLTMIVGLGEAIDQMNERRMNQVEQYNLALARRVHAGMVAIPQLRVVSPAPGPGATAMVAALLPQPIIAEQLQKRMRERHNIVIKKAEERWFNGIRLSPHIFNTEAEVERALAALRIELSAWNA